MEKGQTGPIWRWEERGMTVQAAGCRPIGRGSPRGPGLRGRGRRRGLRREGESLQLPKAEGGWVEAATPHCRCAFDVAQAVGQRTYRAKNP